MSTVISMNDKGQLLITSNCLGRHWSECFKRYSNPDNDPGNDWREGNLTAKSYSAKDDYGIQSPFTGVVHYPAGNGG